MINRVVMGISSVLLGALIACVPNFILTVSDYCRHMEMGCVWAAKAEFGVGVLIVFLGILLALVEAREIRMGISTALGFIGILSLLMSRIIIGFCDGTCSPECTCSSLTIPVMTGLSVAVSVISFINAFYLSTAKNT